MIETQSFAPLSLIGLVLLIAFLYASVGFGGASGYLAAMSLYAIAPPVMASTALILNILVSGIAFWSYYRARHFLPRLLWPFLITSIPTAFLGGYIRVEDRIYFTLLYLILTYLGLRMILFKKTGQNSPNNLPGMIPALVSGAVIGLLSGILGIGGGIFLSPLIVLADWGTSKQASASAAAFILINSTSSVLGRMAGSNLQLGILGISLLPAGFIGALGGSYLGAYYLSSSVLRRLLGLILLIAVARFWIGLF